MYAVKLYDQLPGDVKGCATPHPLSIDSDVAQ